MAGTPGVGTAAGLRAAPKDSNGLSSAQLVFIQPLTLPGELTDVYFVQEAAADDFNTQLATKELPPMCQPGLGNGFFYVLNASFVCVLLKHATFFYVLFLSVWQLMRPKRMMHYFAFFS